MHALSVIRKREPLLGATTSTPTIRQTGCNLSLGDCGRLFPSRRRYARDRVGNWHGSNGFWPCRCAEPPGPPRGGVGHASSLVPLAHGRIHKRQCTRYPRLSDSNPVYLLSKIRGQFLWNLAVQVSSLMQRGKGVWSLHGLHRKLAKHRQQMTSLGNLLVFCVVLWMVGEDQ